MLRARLVFVCVIALGGCPSDDTTTTSDSQGDTGSTSATVTASDDDVCPPGNEGCPCDGTACMGGLICVDDVCIIDTESDSGPSTTLDSGESTASSSDGGSSSSADSGDASSSDTGTMTCTDSTDCPRDEVCTAPARSPGVPAGDFTCSTTCAGLGIDSAVCTDDASCCGTHCSQGSCVAP